MRTLKIIFLFCLLVFNGFYIYKLATELITANQFGRFFAAAIILLLMAIGNCALAGLFYLSKFLLRKMKS